MRIRKRWLLIPLIVLVVAFSGFFVWASGTTGTLLDEAVSALKSDAVVQVSTDKWLVFTPRAQAPTTGYIFYPGGRVLPEAYAPYARALAEAGNLVVIVPMPLNLAVLDSGRASEVMTTFPQVEHWAIGGHSLGGSMAAAYAFDNPDTVQGLVLLAAYPAGWNDLSSRADLVVASIYGTRDGLANPDDIENSKALLPVDTLYLPIEGGNHAQFGWYGDQPGDNPATISRVDQQAEVVAATLLVLEQISQP